MLFHHLPLFGGKVRSLFQDLVGHRDFAQIVQVSAAAQGDDCFLVQTQVTSQIAGILSQALAVTLGVGITTFNA